MSGRQWIKLYSISNSETKELTDERIISIDEAITTKENSGNVGSSLVLSRSALKLAKSYYNKAVRLNNGDAFKKSVVQGYIEMIDFMCDSAEMLLTLEEIKPMNILLKVPAKAAVLEYKKQGVVDISVYNYDSRAIENATLKLIDAYGNNVGETLVSVGGNDSAKISIRALIADGGAKDSMVDAELVKDGTVLKSEKVVVMKQMEKFTVYGEADAAYITNTDSSHIFTVDGQKFILLDQTENDNSKYLCITKDIYGPSLVKFHANSQIYDAEDENSVAYWLNNTFASTYLPEDIIDHIDFNHYYTTEKGSTSSTSPFDTQTKCGLALLSMTELNSYKDKLGLVDGNFPEKESWMWMLRSMQQRPDWTWNSMEVKIRRDAGECYLSTTYAAVNAATGIRPIFYLDKNFFTDVTLDWGSAGKEIKKVMRENYTREELAAIYSEEELAAYYDLQEAPENVKLVGDISYGGYLTPDYVNASFGFAWMISESESGEYEYIEGASENKLTLDRIVYDDKYVKCEITMSSGVTFETEPVYVKIFNDEIIEGNISSCEVRGIMELGNTLHVLYSASDGIDDEDIICNWYKSSGTTSGYVYAGSGLTCTTTASTTDEYYYVEVALENGSVCISEKVLILGYDSKNAYWPLDMADSSLLVSGAWPRTADGKKETLLEYTATGIHADGSKHYFSNVLPRSNDEYAFEVDGQKFILVDSVETSDTARYKIIADMSYGKEKMNETGMAKIESRMPNAITRYIDHTVWYEGSVNTWGDYICYGVSGVYPLSPKDLKNYGDKVGLISCNYLTGKSVEYLLRGSSKTRLNGSYMYAIKSYDEANDVLYFRINGGNAGSNTAYYAEIRPVFYIDYSFFKEVNLDMNTVGSKVREILKENYKMQELSGIYSEGELLEIYGEQ